MRVFILPYCPHCKRARDYIEELKKEIDIPASIKDWVINKKDFEAKLDWLVENAFDDQCTGANPVYPLMEDIRKIYLDAFEGKL